MPSSAQTKATFLAEEPAQNATALLIIDMISDWNMRSIAPLLKEAHAIAPSLAELKKRCQAAGVPAIYVNDNLGRWRSDFKTLVKAAREKGGMATEISELLAPGDDDYFVLKPKHSAFFSTPLDLLLEHLKVHKLILTGVSADQCVLSSVADALMRDYEVTVAGDCIAAPTPERTAAARRHLEEVMKVGVMPHADIELPQAAS